jgi:hypothetical protein
LQVAERIATGRRLASLVNDKRTVKRVIPFRADGFFLDIDRANAGSSNYSTISSFRCTSAPSASLSGIPFLLFLSTRPRIVKHSQIAIRISFNGKTFKELPNV